MFAKFINEWLTFVTTVSDKYIALSNRWLVLALLPVYVAFVLLFGLTLVLVTIVYAIKCKLEGSLTFTETFEFLKEGFMEELDKLKG